jgi:hypothetical protein
MQFERVTRQCIWITKIERSDRLIVCWSTW